MNNKSYNKALAIDIKQIIIENGRWQLFTKQTKMYLVVNEENNKQGRPSAERDIHFWIPFSSKNWR